MDIKIDSNNDLHSTEQYSWQFRERSSDNHVAKVQAVGNATNFAEAGVLSTRTPSGFVSLTARAQRDTGRPPSRSG